MSTTTTDRQLLWIVPKWPFPGEDGARRATINLLSNVTAQGECIDLIALAGTDEKINFEEARKTLGVRNIYVVRREASTASWMEKVLSSARSFFRDPFVPLTMRQYCTGSVKRALRSLLNGKVEADVESSVVQASPQWNTLVYDGLHTAIHSSFLGRFRIPKPGLRIFYRAHNRESDIWTRRREQCEGFFERLLLWHQGRRVRIFEDSVVRACVGIAPVSSEDLTHFLTDVKGAKGIVVPIGYEFGTMPDPPPPDSHQIMFLGRLDWYPNLEGMKWFLRRVWPKVVEERKDLRLVIAGSGDSTWLNPFLSLPNLQFIGRVESVDELYRNSLVSLVPVFYGSGTRVKAIEACRFARVCLSTEIGVEGVGLQAGDTYIRAESPSEWITALLGVTRDKALLMGQRAWDNAHAIFDSSQSAKRFREILSW